MPPLPIGSAGLKVARGMTKLGWHWWPEFNSINSVAYDGRRPCVQRSTCQSGCNEGAKASTDLTHWPKAIARGATAHHRRPRPPDRDRREGPRDRRDLDRPRRRASTSSRRGSWSSRPTRSGRRGCCCSRRRPAHPDGLANSSGLVGKRLMMHPFANVAGLFEDPLMSWQGQFGDLIESLEFYETDEKRGFVRGARWGLAPTGGPINTALPSRAGEQIWGPDHHAHVRTHLGHGANWGLFAEDLPDEANHITLSSTVTDSVRHPGPRGPLHDGRQRPPDARLPHRAGEGVDGCGRRLQDRRRPADALLGLASARDGPDGRRPDDARCSTAGTGRTTWPTCTSSTGRAS